MQYGLVCAGPISEYLADKLPSLAQDLGPVLATAYRSASRIVNTLGAGKPVRTADEFAHTRLILICSPREHLPSVLPALQSSSLDWSGKQIVLCNCGTFSSDLEKFRALGATVASVTALAVLPGRYILEGDRTALRAARNIVRQLKGIAVEISAEHISLFCAAQTFSSSLFTPLIHACFSALKATGITGALHTQLVEALFQQHLRMYLYSGRKSWSGTVADGDQAGMARELEALQKLQSELAVLYGQIAEAAPAILKSQGTPDRDAPLPESV